MYTEAFRHHVRENGARLLKFDNFATLCMNPSHEHLPGIYSTEPIEDAAIEFLRALDAECPDVFLMLYWGYGSPWWLLYGDTLFESGIDAEAANPSELPAISARNTAVHQVDQAQWHATRVRDIPPLGRDSLGVWLSDWPWNNQIGKDRWQGGLVMDICRGNLLAADLDRRAVALAAGAKGTGRVYRALEGPARVLRQFTLHSRQPLEGRALRLLLHRREAGVPGPAQRLLARQPAAAGVESGLGPAGQPGLGPLPLVSRSGATHAGPPDR